MTVLEPEIAPPELDEPGIAHIMCCIDENTGLCGEDISDSLILSDGDSTVNCVGCEVAYVKADCPVAMICPNDARIQC